MCSDLLRLLQHRLPELGKFFENDERILAVYLFGSQVDGYATSRSDLDMAVLFGDEISLRDELALETEIAEVLGTDRFDLLNLSKLPLGLRHHILATGELLYERDFERLSDFIEHTLIRYLDFQPILETYDREFAASMERDYAL